MGCGPIRQELSLLDLLDEEEEERWGFRYEVGK